MWRRSRGATTPAVSAARCSRACASASFASRVDILRGVTSAKRWDVIGIGENSVDFVNILPSYPQPRGPSAKMRIRERRVMCGGQMATAMCACASLGLRAKYVGVTGTDDNGRRIRAELQGRHVDISDLVTRDVDNRSALILIDESTGDRMVLWDRDDRLRLHESELPVDALSATAVVHVDDVDDEVAIRAARLGRAAGAMVTSDIDRVTPRTEELMASVTHAIFAEHVPKHRSEERRVGKECRSRWS